MDEVEPAGAIPEAERLLQAILETTNDHIYVIARDGRYRYASRAARERRPGATHAILPEDADRWQFSEETLHQLQESRETCFRTGQAVFGQALRGGGKPGSEREYRYAYYPLIDPATGRVEQALSVACDITAESQAIQQLRIITDAAPVLISYIDHAYRYRYANQAYADWFDLPLSAIAGQEIREVLGQAAFDQVRPYLARALAGEKVSYEISVPYERGGTRFVHTHVVPDLADDGSVRGVVGIIADITGRRQAEEQARRAAEENAALLRERTLAVQRQRQFVRDVLYSVSEGKFRLCDAPADLPAPLPRQAESVSLTRTNLYRLRELRHFVAGVARERSYSAERVGDLVTAVGEAAMNAVVHGKGGEGTVCASENTIQVWITDQGSGIAEENIHKTFQRGYTTAGTLGHGFWLMLRTADRVYLLTGSSGTTLVLEMDRVLPIPGWF